MAYYKTEVYEGVTYRMKHWVEHFEDESTGELIKIGRKRPVKRDGVRCNQFGNTAKVINQPPATVYGKRKEIMKTAEEILKQHLSEEGFDSFSEMVSESSDYRTESVIESCMKAYGRQIAEQALKDGADRAEMIDDGTSNYDAKSICKESITSTQILTP